MTRTRSHRRIHTMAALGLATVLVAVLAVIALTAEIRPPLGPGAGRW